MGQVPVFVVEDSQPMQVALRDLLEHAGAFKVVGTAGGENEATDWLLQHRQGWNVAIVDLLLANGSGFGLLQRFRRQRPNGKIVVFSEFASPAIKCRCLELGADAAFLKSEMRPFIQYIEDTAHAD